MQEEAIYVFLIFSRNFVRVSGYGMEKSCKRYGLS
jgi:hypothetical protein